MTTYWLQGEKEEFLTTSTDESIIGENPTLSSPSVVPPGGDDGPSSSSSLLDEGGPTPTPATTAVAVTAPIDTPDVHGSTPSTPLIQSHKNTQIW